MTATKEDKIGYGQLVENALRSVVRNALRKVEREGLPGEHHFYITTRTKAPGVRLPKYLVEKFPDEITLVLQHQFWDLVASEETFAVTLTFSGKSERLVVPYSAIASFVDPSIDFGLQFKAVTTPEELGAAVGGAPIEGSTASENDKGTPADSGEPKVVKLDTFRRS